MGQFIALSGLTAIVVFVALSVATERADGRSTTRSALLELADLGTAVFSAGLIVAVLQGLVSLVT